LFNAQGNQLLDQGRSGFLMGFPFLSIIVDDAQRIVTFDDDPGNTALSNISRNLVDRQGIPGVGLSLKSHDHHGNRRYDQQQGYDE
jgi:hypothetical protein